MSAGRPSPSFATEHTRTSSDLGRAHEALLSWLASHSWQGVHGIGVGCKEACGAPTETPAVRVHVMRKRARRHVPIDQRIPAFVDGVPVDVVVSPCAVLHGGGGDSLAPPPGSLASGMSVGRDGVPFGTLGAVCRSTRSAESGQVFVLSNNHVFANLTGRPGDAVFHPGPGDAAGAENRVARLARAWPIEPGGVLANQVDAAIASLDPGILHSPIVQPLGVPAGRRFARVNTIVGKHGRTTGFTRGRISDVNHTELIGLSRHDRTHTALFKHQIRIVPDGGGPFAMHGDSGSLVLEVDSANAIGLYFAGPPDGSYGLANDLATVFERLEITFLQD